MNKDVIYIDIEDDITAIIGKVKQAGAKIVALVPPKRAGVLQSVVNLKLLQKAAEEANKRVVLITNDHSLVALAAGVAMPVARNLQSRPEVPEVSAPDVADEEVIDGASLPVGDIAQSLGDEPRKAASVADEMSDQVDLGDAAAPAAPATMATKKPSIKASLNKAGRKLRIPDFTTFRNKIFLFGGGGVVLILLLVWAFVFAPHATVTISAQTIAVNVDDTLTLDPKAASADASKFLLKPNIQQLKKSVAAQFAATGTKDIGNKASGTVHVSNCDSSSSFLIPAGTTFTSEDGHAYTNNAALTVPGFTGSASACRNTGVGAGKVDAAVTAANLGDEYNIAPSDFSIAGYSGRDVYAKSTDAMSGGSHQQATVVSQDDVDKAKQQLAQPDLNAAKAELKKQFTGGDFVIIEESFTSDQGTPSVEPAVGQPAQQAKISIETTYTYTALPRQDIKSVLTNNVNDALKGKDSQQTYALGDNTLSFTNFTKQDDGTFKTQMDTTAYIGPKIDTKALAQQLVGKRFGEIQALITQIQGVNKVDVNFSPFWVNTAPSANKIDINFSIANGK